MPKTKLTLLLLTALLAGVCLGFFGYSAIIRARIRHFSQIPENMPRHITERLTERLQLDAAQQEQVLAVFLAYESRLQESREQSRASFRALRDEMSAEIARHLTPAQAAEHRKMLEELDQRFRENRALLRAFSPSPAQTNTGN